MIGTLTTELAARLDGLPVLVLTRRQRCDLELLANGAFAPLRTFMGRAEHASVCRDMRLPDGTLWPIPIMLDVSGATVEALHREPRLLLVDGRGLRIAVLDVEDAWPADRQSEIRSVYGTDDRAHPGVAYLMDRVQSWYLTGHLTVLSSPDHPELPIPVLGPEAVRDEIQRRGWERVVAFNTRNPMHAAHRALVLKAAGSVGGAALIHPVVGETRPGDVPADVRVRCYQALMRSLPADSAMLSVLPLAMRMAGPREALWHALIRKNYGATHFIVGRDHAGPGKDSSGRPFYSQYAAQELVREYEDEIGIGMVPGREIVYVEGLGHVSEDEVPVGVTPWSVSGTELRRYLREGIEIPDWLAAPEVVAELLR